MPTMWNLTRAQELWTIQDVNSYVRYQLWNAQQTTKRFDFFSRWMKKYKTRKWESHEGDVMQGVMAEHSAISKQSHTPKNITETPLKTQVRHFERINQGRVKRHLFESPAIHFLPSWRDFRTNQLDFATKDIDRQIIVANENFLRWQALQQCKWAYVVGANQPLRRVAFGEATDTTAPKDANFFVAQAQEVGSGDAGFLTFKAIRDAVSALQLQIGAPSWEDMKGGAPKENEVAKGKYILTGDPLIYNALEFDAFVLATKSQTTDFLNSTFRGPIGSNVVFMEERYPLRYISTDGSFPAPEIEEEDTVNAGRYENTPNPPYVGLAAAGSNADIGIAFLEGYLPFETFDVGPPPAEFSKGSMSAEKYSKLRWNGEVRMTDNLLVNYGSNNLDTNKYGEYVQLIADTTMGIVPNTAKNLMAIIFRLNFKAAATSQIP